MRVFAALRPTEPALDHLELALGNVGLAPAGGAGSSLRMVPRESWHLTLAFYGQVPDGSVAELTARLAQVAAVRAPSSLELAGAGVFHHSTLWVGARTATGEALPGGSSTNAREVELVDLMTACEEAGADISRTPARDRRRAHLTVARARRGQGHRGERRRARERESSRQTPASGADAAVALHQLAHALSVYRGPRWRLDEIRLVSSELGAGRGGGPRYETLAHLPLSAAD